MMGFDDRSGKTQPTINALEQQTANTAQAIRTRVNVSGGMYPKTATPAQVVYAASNKPRSL